jgi:hypothetical protein
VRALFLCACLSSCSDFDWGIFLLYLVKALISEQRNGRVKMLVCCCFIQFHLATLLASSIQSAYFCRGKGYHGNTGKGGGGGKGYPNNNYNPGGKGGKGKGERRDYGKGKGGGKGGYVNNNKTPR